MECEKLLEKVTINELRDFMLLYSIKAPKFKAEFEFAKELIRDGIDIAGKNNHPGTIAHWQKELLRIAFLEKDEETIRLMELGKQETTLERILYYHAVLIDDYRSDLLNVYLPAIKVAATKVNDRNLYKNLVNQMKKIIKDISDESEQMLDLAKELSTSYWRRRAMVEELTKFIQLTTF